jgi:ornithine cyclodeaminase
MLYVTEAVSQATVTRAMALEAVRNAFIAAAEGEAISFPTLQGTGRDATHRFSVKAARINATGATGLKIGAYWPSSDGAGLSRGSSAMVFLDDTSGRIEALVQTSAANAYRTSAGAALSVDLLAAGNASALAVFGAGLQAFHGVMAIRDVRPITDVFIVNRSVERGEALVGRLRDLGISARCVPARTACENSQIMLTVTASRQPLFEDGWIKHGLHIACMGSDDRGKQELPVALLQRARLFADLVVQSTTVGEFQHVATEVAAGQVSLRALGEVASGASVGRLSADEVTIFDSSGIALQDIFLAEMILRDCMQQGKIIEL